MGIKRATIYDVALLCGVSPRTVTRAFRENSRISEETKQKILDVAEKHGYRPNTAAARLAKSTIRITAAILGGLPVFNNSMAKGFRRAYTQLCDFKADLDVLVAYTPEEIEQCHRKLEEKLETHACDGLIIVADRSEALLAILERYRAAHIPIVKVLQSLEPIESIFHVRNDYAMSARMACELLALSIREGSVILFSGPQSNDIHAEICAQFREQAERRGITVSEIFDMNDDPAYAARETEKVLRRNPNARGIYITSANSAAILRVLGQTDRNYTVIASDIFPELARLIENGTVLASIYQNEWYQARLAYEYLYEHIAYNKEIPKRILTRPQFIMQSNLDAFIGEWEDDLLPL